LKKSKLILGEIFLFMSVFFLISSNVNGQTIVDNVNDLTSALTADGDDEVVLSTDLSINSKLKIVGNKILNLGTHKLTLNEWNFASNNTNGGQILLDRNDNKKFTLKNGTLSGGPTAGLQYHAYNIGVVSVGNNAPENLDVTIQDITHTGTGGFFKGKTSNIILKGKIDLRENQFNIRAKNMTFYGNPDDPDDPENVDFYGYTSATADPGDWSQYNGGLNLSFDGYQTFRGPNQRILNINKNAKVILKNDNNTTGNARAYANNIANFAEIHVYGYLEATAIGTSIRTTSSSVSTGVATENGRALLQVYEGASFKTASTATTNTTYGTVFSYPITIRSKAAKVFDMRFFGTGQFFYAWRASDFYLDSSDIAFWDKSKKGVGNPNYIWQNVDWMNIIGFTNTGSPKANSSNPNLAANFTINNASRISNDIRIPAIIPDSSFTTSDGKYVVNNGDNSFYGSTDYTYPDNSFSGDIVPDTKISLYSGTTEVTSTMTNSEGKWEFSDFQKLKLKAGTYTLKMTDSDQRIAPDITFTVKDTLPPEASTKLYKFVENTATALTNPKNDSILSFKDETSSDANIKFEYNITEERRQTIIANPGFYEVPLKVTDESGNSTIVSAPVIVYEKNKPVTTDFVSGQDFEVPFDEWNNGTPQDKRNIVTAEEYGNARGYTISGNTVTNVTEDSDKFIINYSEPAGGWRPGNSYEIEISSGTYKKILIMTLGKKDADIVIKQVYQDTDKQIYSNLETQQSVVTISTKATMGDPLHNLIDQLILDKKLIINYTGYDEIDKYSYVVKVNGEVVNTDKVPEDNFEIIYSYNGQIRFETTPNLDFGSHKVGLSGDTFKLSDTSESEIRIINTLQDKKWQLKLTLPDGIINTDNQQKFLGDMIYRDSAGTPITINESAQVISNQGNDKTLKSTVDVRGNNNSGIYISQSIGNYKGRYSGNLIWSLEDVITP